MDTREITAGLRMSHWAQIIRERQESGLTVKAYCEKAGFHENSYFYWQNKLREAACEHLPEIRSNIPSTNLPKTVFTEVKISGYSETASNTTPDDNGVIRLEIFGVKICADSLYLPANIAALLKELSEPC